MTYSQYSNTPITGYSEAIKNRIDSNSNAANSEAAEFPTKFDLFVNKENTSVGSYPVSETHILSQLVGSTLYLDHRPAVDATGGISTFVISDGGVIDTTQTDVASASIEFSVMPTASPFNVTYSAAADKVQDSHLNALQNSVMAIENTLGITSPVNGQGTGIVTMPLVTTIDPRNPATYSSLLGFLPNMVMLRHLNRPLAIGSTDVAGIPGYATGVLISIGSTGAISRDVIVIDTNSFTLSAADGAPATYRLGTHTGEAVNVSGRMIIASQLIVGQPGGAYLTYQPTVPIEAGSFYSGCAIQAHGGIWFGSGLSGNGSVTFITTSGQSVDVQGALVATTLDVNGIANFDGNSTFNGYVAVNYPGYISTNNDILLQPKGIGVPSLIDSLDPSYANWAIKNPGTPGLITNSPRYPIDYSVTNPYSNSAKLHPVFGFYMYPIIGGWTYTGLINYEKASVGSDKNIILLSSNMSGIGLCSTTQVGAVNLGGGTASYGDYCTGLFNPGDTFLEIKGASDTDAYSYPIYYHVPFTGTTNTVTGINVYVAADDISLQTSIAGKSYRLYQPGNAPVLHVSGWAGAQSQPLATYGTLSYNDYPYATVNAITNPAWIGGNNVLNNNPQYKHTMQNGSVAVWVKDALEKSIGNITGTSILATGIAYIYVAGSNTDSTTETAMQVRASPTPFGLAGPQMQMGSPRLIPGQNIAVGEIIATTTNGTSWTSTEAISYRPNGQYDSCWLPLVEYKATSVPSYGRCLPFYTASNQSDADDDGGYYQFWVEHNLGPVAHRGELEYHVFAANYGSSPFALNPGAGGTGQSGVFKLGSHGSQNLWSPYASNLSAGSTYARSINAGSRGFLKDLTPHFHLAYWDTRFAKFVWDSQSSDLGVLRGHNNRLPGYIRVMIKRAQ